MFTTARTITYDAMNYTSYFYILLIGGLTCSPFSISAQEKKQSSTPVLTEKEAIQADALFIDATNDFLNENYSEAIKSYEKVKNSYPNDGAIYHQIAKAYEGLEETNKAIQYEEIATELSANNKFYYLFLAELYREVKAWKKMATCYEAVRKNTTGAEEFYYDLGHLYAFFFQVSKRKYVYAKEASDNNYLTQKIPKKERKRMDQLLLKSLAAYDSYDHHFGITPEFIRDKQEILLEAGQLQKAVNEGDRLILKYPTKFEYILINASLYSTLGKHQEAVNYLLQKRNENQDYHLTLTLITNYEKLGKTEKVNNEISTLISNENVPIQERLNILVKLIKSTSEASSMEFILELTKQLVVSQPENIEAKFLLADVYFFSGQLEEARVAYLASLGLKKDNKYAWQQVLAIDLKTTNYKVLTVDALLSLEAFPNEAIFHYWLATAYTEGKDYPNAISSLLEASRNTDNPELLIQVFAQLGDNYHYVKKHKESDLAYDDALTYSPNSGYVLNNYSYYLSTRKEDLNKAKSMSKRLIMLYPNEPSYLDTYGWVLYQMEQYKEASLYLEKAASQTKSTTIFEHYGDVLYQLGKKDDALVWWKKAQSFGSTSSLLNKKISDQKLYEE